MTEKVSTAARSVRTLKKLTLGLLVIQLVLTWPLWGTSHSFPQIPLIELGLNFSFIRDRSVLGLLWGTIIGLVLLEAFPHRFEKVRGFAWGLLAIELVGLMILNQHRLQAWSWQIGWYAVCFASCEDKNVWKWLRRLTISLYFYSAISKVDRAFLESHGQTLLEGFLNLLPGEIALSPNVRWGIVLSFPLFELLVAIMLLFPATRRVGWHFSLVLHLGLILILGPFGLNHHLPVLVWNAFFLLQNSLLFAGEIPADEASSQHSLLAMPQRIGWGLLWFALLFPITEWINVCDVWPGWGLYAARGAKVQLEVPVDQLDHLPDSMRPFCEQSPGNPEWSRVDLFRWSFSATHAPAYPEDRFLLAVCRAIVSECELNDFRIRHFSTARRFSGGRDVTTLTNAGELDEFLRNYWLNVRDYRWNVAESGGGESPSS